MFHIAKNIVANKSHVTLYSFFVCFHHMLSFLILEKMFSCLHLPDELEEMCVEKVKKKGWFKNAINCIVNCKFSSQLTQALSF